MRHPARRVKRLGGAVVHVELAATLREDVVGHARDRDLHVAVAKVDPEGHLGGVLERELDPWPAAAGQPAGIGLRLIDEAALFEIGHQRMDRGPGQAGRPGDLRLAHPAAFAQHADHPFAVAVAKPGQRAVTPPRHRHRIMARPLSLSRALTNLAATDIALLTNSTA